MSEELAAPHLAALESRYAADVAAIHASADLARAAVDGDTTALHAFAGNGAALAAFPEGPLDDLSSFSLGSENALIPDTPLIDAPLANSSLAFDDAPLWQN